MGLNHFFGIFSKSKTAPNSASKKILTWGAATCTFFCMAIYGVPAISSELLQVVAKMPESRLARFVFFPNSPAIRILSEQNKIYGLNSSIFYRNRLLTRALLDSEVPLNSTDYFKQPLYEAAQTGDIELAAELLKRGASINPNPNLTLGTPIWGAASANQAEMIRFLVRNEGDLNLHPKFVKSPLEIAISRGNKEAAAVLRELGANTETSSNAKKPTANSSETKSFSKERKISSTGDSNIKARRKPSLPSMQRKRAFAQT